MWNDGTQIFNIKVMNKLLEEVLNILCGKVEAKKETLKVKKYSRRKRKTNFNFSAFC